MFCSVSVPKAAEIRRSFRCLSGLVTSVILQLADDESMEYARTVISTEFVEYSSIQDLPVIATVIFSFALTLLVAMKLHEGLTSYQFFATSATMEATGKALSIMDYGAVFLMIGLFFTSIYLASQIRTTPVFLPVSILSLVVTVFVSAQLANVYAAISKTGAFRAAANTLPFATKILYNFPLVIGVGGFMIILALYARQGGGGQRVPR